MFTFETFIFIVLFAVTLLSLRRDPDADPLSLSNSLPLRGVFALCIIIFHVAKETDLLFPVFDYLSTTVVAMFFFISGYGLMKSYMKDEHYADHYLKKRFFRLVLPYLFVTMLYWFYNLFIGNDYSLLYVLEMIYRRTPIVTYSWFILSIIFCYFVFYVVMLVSGRNTALLNRIFIGLGLISFIYKAVTNQSSFFMTEEAFCLGIIYVYYEQQIRSFISRHSIVLLASSIILSALLILVLIPLRPDLLILDTIKGFLFILAVLSFMSMFRLKNPVLDYLGRISMEIYMTQGLAKMAVRRFYGGPLFVQDLFIFIITLILSSVISRLFEMINSWVLKP